MVLELNDTLMFFGTGLGNLFGTGVILGIVGLMIFFFFSYKFQFPPMLNMLVLGIAGYLIAGSLLGDWVKALVLIGFGGIIAIVGYRILNA